MSGPPDDLAHAPMPGAEGLVEPLRSRWSPSVFDDRHELGADDVELLLQAARWAPSAGNTQPWSLVVAPRGSAQHAALVATLSRGNSGWVPRASLVVVFLVEAGEEGPSPTAAYAVGQSAAHLTIQARAMGLHTHQFAGFDHAAFAAAMDAPGDVLVLAGVAVGVRGDPAEVPERDAERESRERTRRSLTQITHADRWSHPWMRPEVPQSRP